MAAHAPHSLIAGFIEFSEALAIGEPPLTPEMDAANDAYDEVERLVRTGPADVAWELVLAVMTAAPDERLDVYAAGLLEDALRLRGAELVEQVEREAAADERFRWALGHIWLDEWDVPPEALDRIVKASGGEIKVRLLSQRCAPPPSPGEPG